MDRKELSKIIDLCRKKGVDELQLDGLFIRLGPTPSKSKRGGNRVAQTIDMDDVSPELPYTEEELLFWSSGDTKKQDD
jgi:hypothetical protein